MEQKAHYELCYTECTRFYPQSVIPQRMVDGKNKLVVVQIPPDKSITDLVFRAPRDGSIELMYPHEDNYLTLTTATTLAFTPFGESSHIPQLFINLHVAEMMLGERPPDWVAPLSVLGTLIQKYGAERICGPFQPQLMDEADHFLGAGVFASFVTLWEIRISASKEVYQCDLSDTAAELVGCVGMTSQHLFNAALQGIEDWSDR